MLLVSLLIGIGVVVLAAVAVFWASRWRAGHRASGGQTSAGPEGPATQSRRTFLRNVIYAVAGAVTVGLAYPAIRYFVYPATGKAGTQQFTPLASLSEFPTGVPTFMTYEERVQDGWTTETISKGAWVVFYGGEKVTVFDPHCTHLGCGFSWHADKKLFLCPCHGGQFDIDGNVVAGPPPRSLDHIQYQIQNGLLLVRQTIRASEVKG